MMRAQTETNAENSMAQGEEYDPFANRPEGRALTSDFGALMYLIKCAMGTGILFLPNAFKRSGYVMSLFCSICMGLLCTYTVVNLVISSQTLCRRHRIPMLSFAQTAELSFQHGPERIRKYSATFRYITYFSICFSHYQSTVVYILYVATSFQQVIEFYTDTQLDKRIYILFTFPIALVLGNVKDLKYLVPFSTVGFVFTFSGILISIYYFFRDFPDPGRLDMFTTVLPVPMYCSIFLFALNNTTYTLPLENTMKNPGRLPGLLACSLLFNMTVYTVFGFLGYNKYTDATCDTVIKNLPLEEGLAQFVKIAISFSVMFSLGLAFYVLHNTLWTLLESKFEGMQYGYAILRSIVVCIAALVALAIPELVPLLGLLSALTTTTIILLVPTMIETAVKWEYGSWFLLVRSGFIFVLWICLLIFGEAQSLLSLISEFKDEENSNC